MDTALFHPVVADWFNGRFGQPTDAQTLAWPRILAGEHTLVAAPTGSGKTLAAFLVCIDRLMRQALDGTLPDETEVVYVSPLKALSNDIRRNLAVPLTEINELALAKGDRPLPIRVAVRTGDTPAAQRQAMLRRPPHILVTTPESLYLLLTSAKGRNALRNVRTVIVDEIHALARDKRGSHLSLSLARLDRLCTQGERSDAAENSGAERPTRIGLSATQRPMAEIACFLVGAANVDDSGRAQCQIVDAGHVRQLDLAVEIPKSELSAVCSVESWDEVYQRLCELIGQHRSTLIFVNTRRMAERVCHYLEEQLGAGHVASHHGSLSRELRLDAEERLKNGELKAIVATASLELGIDIGMIDLVCQIGSPRSIATFLQRVGRAGHALGKVPKGRLFALTRDELLEALALIYAVGQGRLDPVEIPIAPLDILAQQIVAAAAAEDWNEDELFEMCRQAWPYRSLPRGEFEAVISMLSEGIGRGNRAGAYLHRDRINDRLRARRGARIAAITSGGAIPEQADYRVVTEGERTFVGTLNEDFAIESQAGDVFQLGNASWRICYVRGGEVTVEDAHGAPATIPFWLGEAPGRTLELSSVFSEFRAKLAALARSAGEGDPPTLSLASRASASPANWLIETCGADSYSAKQALDYVEAQAAAIGVIPTQQQVVFERFFDESGGMQLVVHAPFGTRINRAWGLALRKSFCRNFDFELQASADDNGIVLSMGPNQSFALQRLFTLLGSAEAKDILVQALLAVPMFLIRWRWNVTRALAVLRQRGGKKVPPPLQRFRADDLLTAVFPMQTACFEHRTGDLEVPDHPLVRQTVHDCLHEAMDLPRWLDVLKAIEAGKIELVARDTREPSPFCYQLLNANPYAFLDDAPLEERRARAVANRRIVRADDVRDLARLDPDVIAEVCAEAWPIVRDADELHDTLMTVGALPAADGAPWRGFFEQLVAAGRATAWVREQSSPLWIASEQYPLLSAAFPDGAARPEVVIPPALNRQIPREEANLALVRGRIEIVGPTSAGKIAAEMGMDHKSVMLALEQLELEGGILRGQFTPGGNELQWCERRLLARIHRRTLEGLRRQVQPVSPEIYLRYLLWHQHTHRDRLIGGPAALIQIIGILQGFEAPAGAWEREILPARLAEYDPHWLDSLFHSGDVMWGRLGQPVQESDKLAGGHLLSRASPITLLCRCNLAWLLPADRSDVLGVARGNVQAVYDALGKHGALFFDDLRAVTELLPSHLEEALRALAVLGLAASDGFGTIRALLDKRQDRGRRHWHSGALERTRSPIASGGQTRAGRWSRFPAFELPAPQLPRAEYWAQQLLERYGVVFRDLLTRESAAPSWRELQAVYRRWEARGEARGGRFVAGVSGEQYALNTAVEKLRQMREASTNEVWQVVSAADPVNLFGIITPGARVPATRSNRVLFIDGRPAASRESGEIIWREELDEVRCRRAAQMLQGKDGPRYEEVAKREDHSGTNAAISH
jgi:ATP-dependent Lhr-like helicase